MNIPINFNDLCNAQSETSQISKIKVEAFSWFTTFPMSNSSLSFQTECHFHSVGLGFGWGILFGLGGFFFVKVIWSKLYFSKISLGSLKADTGTLHATEGNKDIRSMSRETLEKQLIPLKTKSSLPFSTDFPNQDKAIQM